MFNLILALQSHYIDITAGIHLHYYPYNMDKFILLNQNRIATAKSGVMGVEALGVFFHTMFIDGNGSVISFVSAYHRRTLNWIMC